MGMFDWVETPEILCPECNTPLKGFQTKSTECTGITVQWWKTSNFYTDCGNCGRWVEFRRKERPADALRQLFELVDDDRLERELVPRCSECGKWYRRCECKDKEKWT